MKHLISWLPIITASATLVYALARLGKTRQYAKWVALGSVLLIVASLLFLFGEPQINRIADSESGRMVVGMLLETVYFGIASLGMALMFLAIIAGRPGKDQQPDPEEQFIKLVKTVWDMYHNSRQGRRLR